MVVGRVNDPIVISDDESVGDVADVNPFLADVDDVDPFENDGEQIEVVAGDMVVQPDDGVVNGALMEQIWNELEEDSDSGDGMELDDEIPVNRVLNMDDVGGEVVEVMPNEALMAEILGDDESDWGFSPDEAESGEPVSETVVEEIREKQTKVEDDEEGVAKLVRRCVICMESESTNCSIGCGHMVMCEACATKLWNAKSGVETKKRACPWCREEGTKHIKIWMEG